MDVLVSDNANAATYQKVKGILHMYHIQSHTSVPHHQHQNYAKFCIRHSKDVMNHVLTFTSVPVIDGYYASCMLCTSLISAQTTVLTIYPLINIYMDKLLIFLPHSVLTCVNLFTTLIPILFPLPLRKRGDALDFPLISGIVSPFRSLWMIPNALSNITLSAPPFFNMNRSFVSNSAKGMMTLVNP